MKFPHKGTSESFKIYASLDEITGLSGAPKQEMIPHIFEGESQGDSLRLRDTGSASNYDSCLWRLNMSRLRDELRYLAVWGERGLFIFMQVALKAFQKKAIDKNSVAAKNARILRTEGLNNRFNVIFVCEVPMSTRNSLGLNRFHSRND